MVQTLQKKKSCHCLQLWLQIDICWWTIAKFFGDITRESEYFVKLVERICNTVLVTTEKIYEVFMNSPKC